MPSTPMHTPESASHRRRVPSLPPLATTLPTGEGTTAREPTGALWPLQGASAMRPLRWRPGLAKGPDRMRSEIIKSV